MGYKEDNARKIASAFSRSKEQIQVSLQAGMIELLEMGVDYCLEHHDNVHQRHAESGDGYGWMLLYNGEVRASRLFGNDSQLRENANDAMVYVKSKYSGVNGWVGIVLATLKPAHYFQVLYEFIPMREAIRDIKHLDFNSIFTPVTI